MSHPVAEGPVRSFMLYVKGAEETLQLEERRLQGPQFVEGWTPEKGASRVFG